jgi:hypothetical protein
MTRSLDSPSSYAKQSAFSEKLWVILNRHGNISYTRLVRHSIRCSLHYATSALYRKTECNKFQGYAMNLSDVEYI